MGTHVYNSLEEIENVVASLPPESQGPEPHHSVAAESRPDGTYVLTVSDELDPLVDSLDPDVAPPHVLNLEANKQRDKILSEGITFQGVFYQTRPHDRENIALGGQSASSALSTTPETPFDIEWIAADNSRVPMDAETMVSFSVEMSKRQSQIVMATRDVKDQINAGQITSVDQVEQAIRDRLP
jgi:hypothetical protein